MIHHGMRNPREIKFRCYAARMTDINEYLSIFSRSKESKKIRDTELNEIILKIQIWTAAKRSMAPIKLEVVNIMNTSILSTWRTAIAVSMRCAFPMIIFRGLLNVRVY